jgi:two-component system, NarL family, nitrate/nitrite response regulator NarL
MTYGSHNFGPSRAEGRALDDATMHEPARDGHAPIRVLVVDADERVRESLAGLLSIGGHVHVVGTAGDPGAALDLISATEPDVVMVDPRLPDVDRGLGLIGRLRDSAPGVRILVMSWSDSLEDRLATCGADGFVRKTFRPSELFAAIQAAGVSLPN